jgi:flagellar biosynthesis protein FliR
VEPLVFSAEEIGAWLGSFLWPMFRIMGFMLAAPVIGTQLVPVRIRLVLSVAIALLVAPLLPSMPQVDGISPAALLIVAQQILIGVALGFFLQLLFQLFVLMGQMIAMQMGLGFASMMDPANGINVAIVSSFYLMFVTTLFVLFDGHLLMLEVLVDSFRILPVGGGGLSDSALLQIVHSISWVFSSAMLLALPALTALLITNFAFGIMTRAAPQLNIFALGFPVALMFGLFIIWISMGSFLDSVEKLMRDAFLVMNGLLL